MKSTAFAGKHMTLGQSVFLDAVESIEVPTLSAYAVEYSEFTPPPNLDFGQTLFYQDTDYEIVRDSVSFKNPF